MSTLYSTGSSLPNRAQEIRQWLEKGAAGDFVLEVFVAPPPKPHVIVVALNGIGSLKTPWGKQHAGKQGSYFVTYEFAEGSGIIEAVGTFHDRLVKRTLKPLHLKRSPKVTSIKSTNSTFAQLRKKKHHTPELTESIRHQLQVIRKPDIRNVLLRTRQAKDATLKNISDSTGMPSSAVKRILARTERLGVVSRQLDVVCKSCAQVMARVPDRDALANLVDKGMSCAKCKTRVSRRCFEPCFFVESSAGQLLDGSKWMGLLVREALQECGISSSLVRTEVIDGPNELDLVANLDGELLFMELKDNRFSIGHAYSFVGKCSQYNPDYSLIVASNGVDADVKDYVSNTGVKAHYLESLDSLDTGLQSLLSEHYANRLTRLVSSIPWDFLLPRSVLAHFGHKIDRPSSRHRFL